jgi:hypothetical protein
MELRLTLDKSASHKLKHKSMFEYIKSFCHRLLIPKLSLESTPQMWAPSFMGGKENLRLICAKA